MAGVGFKFTYKDLGMKDTLTKLQENCKSVEKPLQACGQILLRSIEKNFRAGGRPDKWAELASSTKREKLKTGHTKILIDRALLKNSIVAEVSGNTLTVGTSMPYARIHQKGGQAGRSLKVTIPARPFLVIQDEDLRWMLKSFEHHLMPLTSIRGENE
jgi:phage virion morphogenesis protein